MNNVQLSVLCLVITLGIYFANKRLYRRFRKLPLMPLVLTPALLVLMLVFGHISWQNYIGESHWLLWLLGPATIAFAVPVYDNLAIIKRHWMSLTAGVVTATVVAVTSSVWLARLFTLSDEIQRSLAVRSVTTPFALAAVSGMAGRVVANTLNINGVRYGMVHDESLCIGCTACMDACREVNTVPEGVSRLTIIRSEPQGTFPDVKYRFFRHSCQHCDHAPCVDVCPTGASFRDAASGIVDVNPDLCVGCQYCIAACPYRVRFIHPVSKTADKCDFCRKTNLKAGKQPACVESCPTKALTFGNLDDPNSDISRLLRQKTTYRYKLALGTKPKVYRVPFNYGEVSQ